MTHLVIGGAGFIGINTAHYFLQKGEDVIVFDNLSRTGTVRNLIWLSEQFPQLEFVQGDIVLNPRKLAEAVELADVVYHLAGQVAVTTSVAHPAEDFAANALGTLHVLEAIRKSQRKPILIFASTNKVYGGMEDVRIVEHEDQYVYEDLPHGIAEDRHLDFHSPYGCSKGTADQYVRDYARIYGLPTVVCRQSCIYGPRQFGMEDQGWVAWFTIASALEKPITIYGNGKQVRDVLHVQDLIRAYELITQKIDQTRGKIYNLGGGPQNTLSLLRLLDHLGRLSNKKINYQFGDWRPGDQPVYISDIRKAQRELGWEPQITTRQGVEMLHDWVNRNLELFENLFRFR